MTLSVARIYLDNFANITTSGVLSHGILAQSVGGGGGNGGFAISGGLSFEDEAVSNAMGGNGGIGGNAKSVTVTNTGAIQILTLGGVIPSSTSGIIAQSIGGGGGSGGFAGNIALSTGDKSTGSGRRFGGAGGDAGNVGHQQRPHRRVTPRHRHSGAICRWRRRNGGFSLGAAALARRSTRVAGGNAAPPACQERQVR
jgi:hypothetical protein